MKELTIIWTMILLSVLYAALTNEHKTQLVLEANANQELEFGELLKETQKEYRDLYRLQKSISICEGGLNEQSLAYRNNNPGNLKAGGTTDNQGHTIFKSRIQGYLSHLSLLQRRYWGYTPYYMNHTLNYATDPNWWKCTNYYYYDRH